MPKQPPNRMVVSDKFYRWLEANGYIEEFNKLKALQDRYWQEGGRANHGLRAVSTEKLRELQKLHDNRLANVREELRRRGV